MRPDMPNMEDLLNQMSTEITRVQNEPVWISTIDLEFSCAVNRNYPKTQVNTATLQ